MDNEKETIGVIRSAQAGLAIITAIVVCSGTIFVTGFLARQSQARIEKLEERQLQSQLSQARVEAKLDAIQDNLIELKRQVARDK